MLNVLFISIPFRGYIKEIAEVMSNELSAQVDVVYCDWQMPKCLSAIDLFMGGRGRKEYNYYRQKKDFYKHIKKEYDYIFVLVGRNVNVDILKILFESQKKAEKILYLWDDVARVNTFGEVKDLFDKIYSSDSQDCIRYGFSFLPLFYFDTYIYAGEEKSIDFSCVGGLHSNREEYLKKVCAFCKNNNFKYNFHLRTTMFSMVKEIFDGRRNIPSFIKFNEISMSESSNILKRSVCAVDMPHATQTGLTIRTIEALASHTKLITTNKSVKEYDFYNENNILVTNSNCENLTPDFLNIPYVDIDEKIVKKYSINNWVRQIFRRDYDENSYNRS